MKIDLNQFEHLIDETILNRGLQYFKKGRVDEPEEIAPGVYETIVDGTEPYTVRITIENETITDYSCSCPYDLGPICKHITAMIFYMQKDTLDLQQKSRGKKAKKDEPAISKPLTVAKTPSAKGMIKLNSEEQVDAILDKMSNADKRAALKDLCNSDRSLRQLFISRYLSLIIPESKELYIQQVKAILKSQSDRKGYIGYHESNKAGKKIYELIMSAEKALNEQDHEKAIAIAKAVIEGLQDVFNYADDSNGSLFECVNGAINIFYTLAVIEIPDQQRFELYEFMIKSIQSNLFDDLDWHLDLYDLASMLAISESERQKIEMLLKSYKSSQESSNYNFQRIQELELKLIQKFRGENKAEEYILQNISNPNFRIQAIETALNRNNFPEALKLAQEGMRQNIKAAPGLAFQFKNILLNVYLKMNETENIIKLARELMKESHNGAAQYFSILKKHVPLAEWPDFINLFLKEIATRANWTNFELMAKIFIWEERWVNLYKLIEGRPSLNILDAYEKYLVKDYAAELIELYRKEILSYVDINVGRSHYRTASRYLRKLRKMGAGPLVDTMVAGLKRQYPSRRALLEELEKV